MKALLVKIYKDAVGRLEWLTGAPRMAPNELVVVCLHSTPRDRIADFERLTDTLLRHFKPFSPSRLQEYFDNKASFHEGPYLLFTFDDGLKNNLLNAQVLHSRGVQALYFLVPEFHKAANSEAYYTTHIRPQPDLHIDHRPEDRSAMSREEVQNLLRMGHHVGSHTCTHRLNASMQLQEIENEISGGKKALEEWLDCSVETFASPNDTFFSVSVECAEVIARNHPFHFVTFPGSNATEGETQMILRRNIEVHWSAGRIKFALGNWDLRRWRPAVLQYRQKHLSNRLHQPFP